VQQQELLSGGLNPSQFATADFNRDGFEDIAAANFGSNNVTVRYGGPNWANTQITYNTPASPTGITTVDYNGDEFPDLALVFATNSGIYVLLGSGFGFTPSPASIHGGSAIGIAAFDVNRDGVQDLIVGAGAGIVLFGANALPPLMLPGPAVTSMAFGGAGESAPLLAAAVAVGGLVVYRLDGPNTFTVIHTQSLTAGPHALVVEDVNGDGLADVLAGDGPLIRVLLRNEQGGLTAAPALPAAQAPLAVAAGDIDADGKLDLFASFTDAGLAFYRGNGAGTFDGARTIALSGILGQSELLPGAIKFTARLRGTELIPQLVVGNRVAAWTGTVNACAVFQTKVIRSPEPTASGWNNGPVQVSFQGDSGVLYSFSGAQEGRGGLSPGGALAFFAEGTTTVQYQAIINGSFLEPILSLPIRIDLTAPALAGLPSACSLRPPNHQLVTIANVIGTDALSGIANVVVTGTSNEPVNGLGDGDTEPDIIINGGQAQVRAERSSQGNGRVYTIAATATDRAGNVFTGTGTCSVPK
jgi:hypothetical protein